MCRTTLGPIFPHPYHKEDAEFLKTGISKKPSVKNDGFGQGHRERIIK